jgi:hypothetical protein
MTPQVSCVAALLLFFLRNKIPHDLLAVRRPAPGRALPKKLAVRKTVALFSKKWRCPPKVTAI